MGIIIQRVLNIYIWVLKAYRQEKGVFEVKNEGVKCSEFVKKKGTKSIVNIEIFGLNVLPMGVVLSDCPGSTEKVISVIFSYTNPL